jgi:signal transduction histidine kinase
MLTFSRIQLGKTGRKIQPMDVNQVVSQLVVDRAFMAATEDIRLKYEPLNDLPPAMIDPNWLSQALSNLLTNAINYTPVGGNIALCTNIKARKIETG